MPSFNSFSQGSKYDCENGQTGQIRKLSSDISKFLLFLPRSSQVYKVVVSVLKVMIVSYPLFIHNGIVNHKNDKCSHCLSQTDLVSSSISETLLSASNTTVKKCVQNVLPKTCPWAIFDKPYSL